MTQRDARRQIVVILDLPGADLGGLGIRERIAACYRFARLNGWHVAEICDTSDRTHRDELKRAVAICKHIGAGLLVYRAESVTHRALGSTEVLGVTAMADKIFM